MRNVPIDFFRRKTPGFTLLEFAVVSVVAGVIALVFLGRLSAYQELAEKTAAEATATNIRSSLRYRAAELLLHNRGNEIAGLLEENPVTWLNTLPPNYLGALSKPQWSQIQPGYWYFDTSSGEVRYRIKAYRYFTPGPSGQPLLRFRVTAAVRPGKDRSTTIDGVNFSLVEPYKWFDSTSYSTDK
ncbi:MAG: type II secretion system protein [Noviherbaspirillum sp.]